MFWPQVFACLCCLLFISPANARVLERTEFLSFLSQFKGKGLASDLPPGGGENYYKPPAAHLRPLIGILSQPGDGDGHETIRNHTHSGGDHPASNISYIAASYVKFVEMGGARVVPLIYTEPEDVLRRKFESINGIILPGGGANLTDNAFTRTARMLLKWALEENDRGEFFPVHGTCLGFELLSILISKDYDILQQFHAEGKPAPLKFVDRWARRRLWFDWMPEEVLDKLEHESLAMENHDFGLSPERFTSNGPLSEFFRILTTTPDDNGKIYVSSVEGKKYPVSASQWHPEKNAFEWGLGTIPHSATAIKITQGVANFLVNEARRSTHAPKSREEEQDMLIYNWDPIYSGKDGDGFFDQSYVFFPTPDQGRRNLH